MDGDSRLVITQVGLRGAGLSALMPPPLAAEALHVVIEPDAAAQGLIRDQAAGHPAEIRLATAHLAGRAGRRTWFPGQDPAADSMLPPLASLRDWYQPRLESDNLLAERMAGGEPQAVDCLTLDGVCAEAGLPLPNLLATDAQGAEMDLIDGASQALAGSLIAAEITLRFVPQRQGQADAGALIARMGALGFDLAGLLPGAPWAPFRAPIGFRGQGYLTEGTGRFLRDPGRLIDPPHPQRNRLLSKLALVAIGWGHIEAACQSLAAVAPEYLIETAPGRPWAAFLWRLRQVMGGGVMPWSLGEILSPADVRARLLGESQRAAYQAATAPERRARMRDWLRRNPVSSAELKRLNLDVMLPFETVLAEAGFAPQAELVRRQRLAQARALAQVLGLR